MTIRQQESLRGAAAILGLSQVELATRMGVPWLTLKKWLLPAESANHREMPEIARQLLKEVLAHERLKAVVAQAALKRYPLGTTMEPDDNSQGIPIPMNEQTKMLYGLQRFQILSLFTNSSAKRGISDAYAYAWSEGVYPYLNDAAPWHKPYEECFYVGEKQLDELHEFLCDLCDSKELPTFYELEDAFGVKKSSGADSRWNRIKLTRACRYFYLHDQFSDEFWKHLLQNGKCPSEAFSITRKFEPSNVYFE